MYNFRTDLADERRDIYRKANNLENEIPGVEAEESEDDNIKTTRVKVIDNDGAEALGKPIGSYITIDIKNLRLAQNEDIDKVAHKLSDELQALYGKHISKEDDILVVGLRKYACNTRCIRP